MPRTPSEFAVHLLLDSGHREEVRFSTIQDFQKWYSNEFIPKSTSEDLINVPLHSAVGEYLVVRPARLVGIRVEPVFSGSVDRA